MRLLLLLLVTGCLGFTVKQPVINTASNSIVIGWIGADTNYPVNLFAAMYPNSTNWVYLGSVTNVLTNSTSTVNFAYQFKGAGGLRDLFYVPGPAQYMPAGYYTNYVANMDPNGTPTIQSIVYKTAWTNTATTNYQCFFRMTQNVLWSVKPSDTLTAAMENYVWQGLALGLTAGGIAWIFRLVRQTATQNPEI